MAKTRPGIRSPTSGTADLLLIGPEGGFSPAEVDEICQSGAETVRWSNSILRIETAALVFATLLISDVPLSGPQEMLDTAALPA